MPWRTICSALMRRLLRSAGARASLDVGGAAGVLRRTEPERPGLATPEVTLAVRFSELRDILLRHDIFSVALTSQAERVFDGARRTAVHWREKSIMQAVLDRDDIPNSDLCGEQGCCFDRCSSAEMDMVSGLTRAVPGPRPDSSVCRQRSGGAQTLVLLESDGRVLESAFRRDRRARPAQDRRGAGGRQRSDARLPIGLIQRRAGELQAGRGGTDPVSRLLILSSSKALKFDPSRVVLNVGGLLIGAVETTSHAAVNALAMLMERPDDLAGARAAAAQDDPAAVDGFVFEALRFNPPFPYFLRICEQDTALSRGGAHETGIAGAPPSLPSTSWRCSTPKH